MIDDIIFIDFFFRKRIDALREVVNIILGMGD